MEDQLRRADLSVRQEAEFKLKEACQGTVRPLLELHMKMAPMGWLKPLSFVLFHYVVVMRIEPGASSIPGKHLTWELQPQSLLL